MSYQTTSKRSPPFCLLIGQKNTKVFSRPTICPWVSEDGLNGVFGQRKCRFPNTAPREEVFENASFSFTCTGRVKTGVLEFDVIIQSYIHTTSMPIHCKGCYRRAFSCGRAKTVQILNTPRVDTFV